MDSSRHAIAKVLRNVPLFAKLDEEDIQALALRCRRREFPRDTALFHRGDPGHTLYVIVSGAVKIQTYTSEGETVFIAYRGPGDPFGEMALIDGKPRMADAITDQASDLVMLGRDDFQSVLLSSPQIALSLMSVLADRLREAAEGRESEIGRTLPGRLSDLLLEAAEVSGVEDLDGAVRITGRLSQQEMADRLGVTRESVNRTLKGFRAAGAVRMDGHTVILTDLKRLRRYAGR